MFSRILICGGRGFNDQELFNDRMAHCQAWFAPKFCIIEGDANGADKMGKIWARLRGIPHLSIAANWVYYSKGAGTLRNTWMLDWGLPDLVIAFPGGPGTANMVEQSQARGIEVWQPRW